MDEKIILIYDAYFVIVNYFDKINVILTLLPPKITPMTMLVVCPVSFENEVVPKQMIMIQIVDKLNYIIFTELKQR